MPAACLYIYTTWRLHYAKHYFYISLPTYIYTIYIYIYIYRHFVFFFCNYYTIYMLYATAMSLTYHHRPLPLRRREKEGGGGRNRILPPVPCSCLPHHAWGGVSGTPGELPGTACICPYAAVEEDTCPHIHILLTVPMPNFSASLTMPS